MDNNMIDINSFRPRVIGANAQKYIGKEVLVLGESISINMKANTITLRMPDDETIIVLLQNNSSKIEPNLLTEVHGKLVSRGNIEALYAVQHSSSDTVNFNKKLYIETSHVQENFPHFFEP